MASRELTLTRVETSNEGSFGILTVKGDGMSLCRTGELPWKDNKRRVSCIPAGRYKLSFHKSPKFGDCCLVTPTEPERDNILIHWANFCGSREDGYESEVLGCIAVGETVQRASWVDTQQKCVTSSRRAFDELMTRLWKGSKLPWTLTIEWADGISPE